MTTVSLEQLNSMDHRTLQKIVAEDQGSPSFEILDWNVTYLSHKGIANPEGLFLFSGQGEDGNGARHWSVVLKILQRERDTPINHLGYWKREVDAVETGLLAHLPGPVCAPRFYQIKSTDDSAWLWMEHIQEPPGKQWTFADYAFAARQLGRWHAFYLNGEPLPDQPWMAVDHCRDWIGLDDPASAWQEPAIAQLFSETEQSRHIQLCQNRELLLGVLQKLPQVFSHFDYQRRNLFIREQEDHQEEVVAIDWAMCGRGAIGSDLCGLIYISTIAFDFPFAQMDELEASTVRGYIAGLREVGWKGADELVWLGYLAYSSLYLTLVFPGGVAWWCSEGQQAFAMQQFGMAGETLAKTYAAVFSALLDRADKAFGLLEKLD